MGILRKLGATVTAVAFVGVGALTAGTTAQAAPQVAPKTSVAVAQKAVAKTKYIGRYHLDPRCMKGRVMCINKKTRKLVYLVNGKQVYVLDARFGGSKTPTRNGAFKVTRKSKNHVSTLYKSKMPYAMFFSGGQAVHYSSDFKARGYNGSSHGCVNIRDKAKLAKIFGQVKVGDKVVVYAG
ncbi:murein L,D-transpeptidase [Kribbella antibiotica]|uniref:Murein L,D-transpeptidase n=1 Tax=Kribbella antibiotica TaxID=190195 RepID=A0A4R4YJ93_9ACTN|nr:L,D-transpeptidase [Kribbella antibiotica]TDD45005.1 murein L,D-transpeptidase [Kribbella antibiotica]